MKNADVQDILASALVTTIRSIDLGYSLQDSEIPRDLSIVATVVNSATGQVISSSVQIVEGNSLDQGLISHSIMSVEDAKNSNLLP